MELLNEVCSGERDLRFLSWEEFCVFLKLFENFGYVIAKSPCNIFGEDFEGVKQLYGITDCPVEMEELYDWVSDDFVIDDYVDVDALKIQAKRWLLGLTKLTQNELEKELSKVEKERSDTAWKKAFVDRPMPSDAELDAHLKAMFPHMNNNR